MDRRLTRYGTFPMVVLSLISLVDNATKGVLGVALQDIQDDLRISDSQAGLLPSAEVLAGALLAVPAGALADRTTRTKVLTFLLPIWSGLSALMGAVQNFGSLFVLRAGLGGMTTVDDPASSSLISDYYEPERRAKAFAIRSVAPGVGSGLGAVVAGLLVEDLGWRWAFVLGGVPAGLLTILVLRLREPARGGMDGAIEAAALEQGLDGTAVGPTLSSPGVVESWTQLLRIRSLVLILGGSAIAQGLAAGASFWGPTYFQRHHDLGPASAAAAYGFSVLLAGILGSALGGVLPGRLSHVRHVNVKIGGYGNLVGTVFLVLGFSPLPLALKPLLLILGFGSILVGAPPLAAQIAEVVPSRIRGSAYAAQSATRLALAASIPLFVGLIADRVDHTVRDVPVAQPSTDYDAEFLTDREDRFECKDGRIVAVEVDDLTTALAPHYACGDVVRGHVGIGLQAVLVLAPVGGFVILAASRSLDRDTEAARS